MLEDAAFQISEICASWCFRLSIAELRTEMGDDAVRFIQRLSYHLGDLATIVPDHIYMNNPIWGRPFITLDDDTLFIALPVRDRLAAFHFSFSSNSSMKALH